MSSFIELCLNVKLSLANIGQFYKAFEWLCAYLLVHNEIVLIHTSLFDTKT